MEENEKKEGQEREEIFSRAVRAGKRTYFFDVKATRRNDYYLTITERKRRYDQDGRFHIEKHKVFLYKEDFDKFSDGLKEVIDFIKSANNQILEKTDNKTDSNDEFSDVKFEDLKKD